MARRSRARRGHRTCTVLLDEQTLTHDNGFLRTADAIYRYDWLYPDGAANLFDR
jgi:hypothetical protein